MEFTGSVPFRQVYFHPVICDAQGETMSKSRGNGIDPLHVIEGASVAELEGPLREARPENMEQMLKDLHRAYPEGFKAVGADALRFTVLSLNSHAQQVQLSLQKFEDVGQKFIDKLWNASRFVILNLGEVVPPAAGEAPPAPEDKWILGRLDQTVSLVRDAFERFYFSEAAATLYSFFWDDVCDWYVELAKQRLRSDNPAERRRVQKTLGEVFSAVLRLLHPITPFITEELWGHLHAILGQGSLVEANQKKGLEEEICALADYPVDHGRFNDEEDKNFELLQRIVREVRNTRSNAGISAGVELALLILPKNDGVKTTVEHRKSIIERAARLKSCGFCKEKQAKMAVCVLEEADLYVNLAEHIDVGAEIKRNQAALGKVEKDIAFHQSKLQNKSFMEKAPKPVREEQEHNLAEAQAKRIKIMQTLTELAQLQ
jgi:valyl-tRNA synthetase